MRERGVQSRRDPTPKVEPARRPAPPTRTGGNFWQALAIVALIAATAGWTTVAVLALRPSSSPAAVATDTTDPNATDNSSEAPVVDAHDVPALEALLPTSLSGTALQVQSWTGDDGYLSDDAWSTSIASFLTGAGKKPADLQVGQAYDPNQQLDGSIGVYRVTGVPATAVRDALIQAWKGDYPDMKVSQPTIGGVNVTKGDFGADTIASYLYLRDDLVYDIETTDEATAAAAITEILHPGASAAPGASASPGASAAPSAAASPAP